MTGIIFHTHKWTTVISYFSFGSKVYVQTWRLTWHPTDTAEIFTTKPRINGDFNNPNLVTVTFQYYLYIGRTRNEKNTRNKRRSTCTETERGRSEETARSKQWWVAFVVKNNLFQFSGFSPSLKRRVGEQHGAFEIRYSARTSHGGHHTETTCSQKNSQQRSYIFFNYSA